MGDELMYAVVQDGGRQFRVSEGDVVDVDFRDVAAGTEIVFDRVLLYQGNEGVVVGQPTVAQVQVVGQVLEQALGPKVYVQKFKRHTNFHRRNGHREKVTRVRIRQIGSPTMAAPSETAPSETAPSETAPV
jgi:large subunit ribosomal protein L21